jgi:hypothetical protein
MMQSNDLRDFYRAYLSWWDSGAKDNEIFARERGLCSCVTKYFGTHQYSVGYARHMREEMEIQFKKAKLHVSYPFNHGSINNYRTEGYSRYMNPMRIAWVRDHAMINGEGGTFHE